MKRPLRAWSLLGPVVFAAALFCVLRVASGCDSELEPGDPCAPEEVGRFRCGASGDSAGAVLRCQAPPPPAGAEEPSGPNPPQWQVHLHCGFGEYCVVPEAGTSFACLSDG